MKTRLSRIFNVFMAVIVLLSSTGFGLVEHSCTVKGKQTSLHKKTGDCCGKSKKNATNNHQKATIKKSKCCTEEEKYENVDYASSISQMAAKFTQKCVDWVKTTIFAFIDAIVQSFVDKQSISANTSHLLTPTGRDILIFVQSFLI